MNQVQRAKDGRINNNQDEDHDHEMTRPRFLRGKTVGDERHQNSDDVNGRPGDVQPFRARHAVAAHDVWSDIEVDRVQSFFANYIDLWPWRMKKRLPRRE